MVIVRHFACSVYAFVFNSVEMQSCPKFDMKFMIYFEGMGKGVSGPTLSQILRSAANVLDPKFLL